MSTSGAGAAGGPAGPDAVTSADDAPKEKKPYLFKVDQHVPMAGHIQFECPRIPGQDYVSPDPIFRPNKAQSATGDT